MDVDALRRELVEQKDKIGDDRLFHRLHESLIEHAMLQTYAYDATVAITGLTAGGSEYFGRRIGNIYTADLPFCVQRIRESKTTLWEKFGEKNRRVRELEARVEQLEARLAETKEPTP